MYNLGFKGDKLGAGKDLVLDFLFNKGLRPGGDRILFGLGDLSSLRKSWK